MEQGTTLGNERVDLIRLVHLVHLDRFWQSIDGLPKTSSAGQLFGGNHLWRSLVYLPELGLCADELNVLSL